MRLQQALLDVLDVVVQRDTKKKRIRSVEICGRRFAQMVDEAMLSQDQFARASGLSRSLIQQKSRPGPQKLDRATATKLSEFLRIGPTELMERIGSQSKAIRIIRLPEKSYEQLVAIANGLKFSSVEDYLVRHAMLGARSAVMSPPDPAESHEQVVSPTGKVESRRRQRPALRRKATSPVPPG